MVQDLALDVKKGSCANVELAKMSSHVQNETIALYGFIKMQRRQAYNHYNDLPT